MPQSCDHGIHAVLPDGQYYWNDDRLEWFACQPNIPFARRLVHVEYSYA